MMTVPPNCCAGCGRVLYDATALGALTVNAYHRGDGCMEQLLFGWDCPAQCGNEVMDAIRAVIDNPDIGPVNLPAPPPQIAAMIEGALLASVADADPPVLEAPQQLEPAEEGQPVVPEAPTPPEQEELGRVGE